MHELGDRRARASHHPRTVASRFDRCTNECHRGARGSLPNRRRAGLPPVPATEGLEGVSLEPVLRDPSQRVKTAASRSTHDVRSTIGKQTLGTGGLIVPQENITLMGFSIRTEDYTEWRVWKLCSGVVRISCLLDGAWLGNSRLYDHTGDDGLGVTSRYESLAYDTSRGAQKDKLAGALRAQFDRAPTKQLANLRLLLAKGPADFGH